MKKEEILNGLNGITYMRMMLEFLNNRPEALNANKSPQDLMNDFKRHCKETNWNGYDQ